MAKSTPFLQLRPCSLSSCGVAAEVAHSPSTPRYDSLGRGGAGAERVVYDRRRPGAQHFRDTDAGRTSRRAAGLCERQAMSCCTRDAPMPLHGDGAEQGVPTRQPLKTAVCGSAACTWVALLPAVPFSVPAASYDSLTRGRGAGVAFMAVDALLTHGPPNAWLARRINRAAMPSVGRAERARILPNAIARLVSLLHISFTVPAHSALPPLLGCCGKQALLLLLAKGCLRVSQLPGPAATGRFPTRSDATALDGSRCRFRWRSCGAATWPATGCMRRAG